MAHIRYDIVYSPPQGWRIRCGKVEGPAYNRKREAINDTLFMARVLQDGGDDVEVHIVEFEERGHIVSSRLSIPDTAPISRST
jgi:hypothetical protein